MSETSPYELLGGEPGVRKLAQSFYRIMHETPAASTIRAMHDPDLGPIVDKLTGFLTGWLGGPRDYFTRPDAPCIMSVHHRYPIGEAERDQWLACMRTALEDVGASDQVMGMLEPAFKRLADGMRSH